MKHAPLTPEEATGILNGLTHLEIRSLAAEAYEYCRVSDGEGAVTKRKRLLKVWGRMVRNRNQRAAGGREAA